MIDVLGNRLKTKFEDPFRVMLPQRTYTIVRIDGKAFHTFTKKLPKPYCKSLSDALNKAAKTLCKEMMGCRLAYGQSDEYSFLLTDFEKDETEMWFSGNIQKITSVASSIFTAAFNQVWIPPTIYSLPPANQLAFFDARVFIIPDRNDVVKYFIWRQNDASRNSLNMLASCHFSHKELMGKGSKDKHEMLHTKSVNWSKEPTEFKRGRVIHKFEREKEVSYTHKKTKQTHIQKVTESAWEVDYEIPVFNRTPEYLDNLIPRQLLGVA